MTELLSKLQESKGEKSMSINYIARDEQLMLGVRPGNMYWSIRARQAYDAIYIPTITHHSATADRVPILQV